MYNTLEYASYVTDMFSQSPMQSYRSSQSLSISTNVSKAVKYWLNFSRQFNKMMEENQGWISFLLK